VRHLVATLLTVLVTFGSASAADHRAQDEKALRDADAAWVKAVATKDLDRITSFYADDADFFPANAPMAKGKSAIKEAWGKMIGAPGFSLSWEPTTAVAAKSGELGYTSGAYKFSITGPDGKPIFDKGKYVEVWKKDEAGNWKVIADIFNSDLPLNPPK
jgi:ketosteroid isomerase-like protein